MSSGLPEAGKRQRIAWIKAEEARLPIGPRRLEDEAAPLAIAWLASFRELSAPLPLRVVDMRLFGERYGANREAMRHATTAVAVAIHASRACKACATTDGDRELDCEKCSGSALLATPIPIMIDSDGRPFCPSCRAPFIANRPWRNRCACGAHFYGETA